VAATAVGHGWLAATVVGTYQLWAQFRLADGEVITAPFTVVAS
jgi:hypothetical protein